METLTCHKYTKVEKNHQDLMFSAKYFKLKQFLFLILHKYILIHWLLDVYVCIFYWLYFIFSMYTIKLSDVAYYLFTWNLVYTFCWFSFCFWHYNSCLILTIERKIKTNFYITIIIQSKRHSQIQMIWMCNHINTVCIYSTIFLLSCSKQ